MPIKRKKTVKRKTAKAKKSTIGSYVRKLNNAPAVKRAGKTVKMLEKKLMAAKKKKAAAVKITRKKLSKC
jgi:predicted transcriptional regulator of viral defense system